MRLEYANPKSKEDNEMILRKYYCIFMAVVVILTGCTNPTSDKAMEGVETSNKNMGEDNRRLEEIYTVEIITYQYKDIHVEYPQIHGLKDTEREEKINNLIEDYILLEIIETEDTVKLEELNMELECRITMQSPKFLSFYYVGESNIDGFKPYDDFYSMTIDLKNVKKLNLSDFIDIDETLVERIKNSTDVTNRAVERGMDKKHLLYEIQDKDEELIIEFLTKGWYGFVLEPDAISVEVGVIYATGVYALIRIPGQVVGDRFIFDEPSVKEE